MGGLMGGARSNHKKSNKSGPNRDNSILFEDLWFADTPHLWVGVWVVGWMVGLLCGSMGGVRSYS